jgi:hypothetical protein
VAVDFRHPPTVLEAHPQGTDVARDAVVKVIFNSELDRNALAGSLLVIDPQSQPVSGDLSYEARTLTFKARQPWQPGLRYTVVLNGVPPVSGGGVIRSVVGVPMGKNYGFGFRTVLDGDLDAPVLLTPANATEVSVADISWTAVEDSSGYRVQIYLDPGLQTLERSLISAETDLSFMDLPEKQYWWRVAALDPAELEGPWSEVRTFLYRTSIGEVAQTLLDPVCDLNNRTLRTLSIITVEFGEEVSITSVKLTLETLNEDPAQVNVTHEWNEPSDGNLLIEPEETAEGLYEVTVKYEGGVFVARFLYAPSLYVYPKSIRMQIGTLLSDQTDLEIGTVLLETQTNVDTELSEIFSQSEITELAYVRAQYLTHGTSAFLIRRLLGERGAATSEEERKLGDASVSLKYNYKALEDLLKHLEREAARMRMELYGPTTVSGTVRGGQSDPFPLERRVWS